MYQKKVQLKLFVLNDFTIHYTQHMLMMGIPWRFQWIRTPRQTQGPQVRLSCCTGEIWPGGNNDILAKGTTITLISSKLAFSFVVTSFLSLPTSFGNQSPQDCLFAGSTE